MLPLFQKLFGRSKAGAKAPPNTTSEHHLEPTAAMPTVEVAHLRLAAILDRLPAELKSLVLKMPDDSVTVALPISTIIKQLPAGVVKVSLATLHRQAPAGVVGPLPPGDKRMVEVPLAEVFRHIRPTVFKRRGDQRVPESPASGFNLFGDSQNPYQIAPTTPEDEASALPMPEQVLEVTGDQPERESGTEPEPAASSEFKLAAAPKPPSASRILSAPPELFGSRTSKLPLAEPPATVAAAPPAIPAAPALAPAAPPAPVAEVVASAPVAPPAPPASPAPVTPPGGERPSIKVPVEPLIGAWPEPIRNELTALNGSASVSLPTAEVTAGLARGRVVFKWGQLRQWIEPAPKEPSEADDATELLLPLKVVAPLFLAAAVKPRSEAKPPVFESDIPAPFHDAHSAPLASEPARQEAPATPTPTSVAPQPEAAAPPALAIASRPPKSVGELFGQPDKAEWTPAEIVAELAHIKGVAGAVVALQEGLLVAHSLPADVKSEIIAAFLPQLFARLNQYSGEMKLGEVDDLLFTTHGAHCQIYRLGYVYFGVLGKPGEPLPWTELRLVADELSRQTQKS